MKIYTKTGDNGETTLNSGQRVSKGSLRVEAFGTIDEVSAQLGLARTFITDEELASDIKKIQEMLIFTMSDLATIGCKPATTRSEIQEIERMIDSYSSRVSIETNFDIPGCTTASAALHVARTSARKAECLACRLAGDEYIGETVGAFLNRLSDLIFVMAVYESRGL